MSENTEQGQQYGSSQQGGPSQPQSQAFQPLNPERQTDESGFRSPQFQHEYERTAQGEQPRDTRGEFVRADEVDRIIQERLAERDREHAKETARLRNQVPQLIVAQHGGGPGNDNHRPSWNLAEQEAARAGEDLPHWHDDEE